jgi:hypothetical protein
MKKLIIVVILILCFACGCQNATSERNESYNKFDSDATSEITHVNESEHKILSEDNKDELDSSEDYKAVEAVPSNRELKTETIKDDFEESAEGNNEKVKLMSQGCIVNRDIVDFDEDSVESESKMPVAEFWQSDDGKTHVKPSILEFPDTSKKGIAKYNEYLRVKKLIDDENISYFNLNEDEKNWYSEYELWKSIWDISSPGCSWRNCIGYLYDINSSSVLDDSSQLDYSAENAFDEMLDTAWVEGVEGYGIGESISVTIDGNLQAIEIYNGYGKYEDLFYKNSRVKELELYINDELYYIIELEDTRNGQWFNFPEYGLESYFTGLKIRFVIRDIYEGSLYQDTCITEIAFLGGH